MTAQNGRAERLSLYDFWAVLTKGVHMRESSTESSTESSIESSAENSHVKLGFYLEEQVVAELNAEASRLDRSLSWVARASWRLARGRIRQLPSDGRLLAMGVERRSG